jgi:hypothetical protein
VPVLPAAESITAKGSVFRSSLAFVETRYGKEGLARVVAALDADARKLASSMILSAVRYPLRHAVEFAEVTDRLFGKGDLALCWEMGKFAGEFEVGLFHKAVLQIGRLDYFFRMAKATWGFYYSTGHMEVEGSTESWATISLREFNPLSKAICYRVGGWMHRTCELFGKQEVSITHTECVLDGHAACVWEGRWR